ncbi:phosphoribosyltransferase family protein [Elizabethkingia anophelis]|uniref:phosphoribosyltransferase family protein n=1 Tax=Elizabethkingia anophelis TaxID=1117645 RepID=UPI000C6E61BA|nr:phosphoribosyltransferase family protein [Elizabethkingia anophelis]PKR31115.1 hypothetical protein CWH99_09995 [Elizabethkingia anophelis]PKR36762.1 hypothetical protein CWI00_06475 [Elizabethkingia anophelis]PRQ79709.1 hypothetical protein CMT60_05605 [Elizabethkingia anophelis]PRQ84056.1 hypothetical protein CMT86_18625 [Elizabethkingia anophelis]PRQ85751.1 hypothetical protein CMT87_06305 [Elizabethkingia anophelis]
MNYHYSLHKIHQKNICPFDPAEYSYFKFGDTSYAKKFAQELFDGFINQYQNLVLEQSEIILFPSPYHSIPTASNFLCSFFKKHLNHFLFQNNRKACIEGKIHRKQTYVEDYGSMNYEQRINMIANDTYYIDKGFIEGKFCIFLDDIKITGSHEQTINKILGQYNISGNFLFMYYAELANNEIHPNIENHYNFFSVKSTDCIITLIKQNDFRFNTRIVKYILLMNSNDFNKVIQNLHQRLVNEFFDLAISNNYHQISDYQINIQQLKKQLLCQLIYKKDNEKAFSHQNLLSV